MLYPLMISLEDFDALAMALVIAKSKAHAFEKYRERWEDLSKHMIATQAHIEVKLDHPEYRELQEKLEALIRRLERQ